MLELVLPVSEAAGRTVSAKVVTASIQEPEPGFFIITDSMHEAMGSDVYWGPGDVVLANPQEEPVLRVPTIVDQWFNEAIQSQEGLSNCHLGQTHLGACIGSPFHADFDTTYRDKFFAILWLGEDDCKWDLYFPNIGHRVPLSFGQLMLFDPGQPHGVVKRGEFEFVDEQFNYDATQYFLAKNITLNESVSRVLGIREVDVEGGTPGYNVEPFNGSIVFHSTT